MHPLLRAQYGIGSLGVSPDAAPPAPGEVFSTPVPDDERGVNFEIARMVQYVRDSVHDARFVDTVRDVMLSVSSLEGSENYQLAQCAAWFEWVKSNYHYLFDPISISCVGGECQKTVTEVIQTPQRMARQIRRPSELVGKILAPLRGRNLETADGFTFKVPQEVLAKASGDCDEAAVFCCAGPAAVGIPTAFRFGGHWDYADDGTQFPNMHHVWGVAQIGNRWIDMDATIKEFKLGQCERFECYGKTYIFEQN